MIQKKLSPKINPSQIASQMMEGTLPNTLEIKAICDERKINPDYSYCIPISLTVNMINPNGKIVYEQIDLPLNLRHKDLDRLVNKVNSKQSAPILEETLDE